MLVDGGVLNNLPADVVRRMGADLVVAVDVTSGSDTISFVIEGLRHRRYVPNGLVGTFEVLYRALAVMMQEIQRRRLLQAPPEVLIRPPIPHGVTALTGFHRTAELIAAGEETMEEMLPRLRRLLGEGED